MRRRLLLIPWSVTIPPDERDPELGEKLRAEASGILAWAILGCLEWQSVGLQPPARVLEATNEYFTEQDSIGRWLEECCVVGAHFSAQKRQLYQSWVKWAEDNREFIVSKRQLLAELRNRLELEETRIGRQNVEAFTGIGLMLEQI